MESEHVAYDKVKAAIMHPENLKTHLKPLDRLVKFFVRNYSSIIPEKVKELNALWNTKKTELENSSNSKR
jgi:hypothetical protein